MSLRSWILVLPLLCHFAFGLCPASTHAQEGSDFNDVVKRAVTEFDHGNWDEASALFRRAHELSPSARTWRGMGLTSFELRRYVEAIAQLEAALAEPRKPLTAQQRKEAESVLKRAREFVSVYRVRVSPAEAEVLVDGRAATLTDGQLYLDPGAHTIVARAPGYGERREDLRAAAGAKDELSLELSVASPPEEPAPTVSSAPAPTTVPPVLPEPVVARPRVWTWVLAGSAVAAGAVAGGLGLGASHKQDDLKTCTRNDPGNCGGIADKGESLQLGTNVSLGLSGALLAGAVTAFFLEGRRPPKSDRHAKLRLFPTGAAIHGSF